jgi:hypothetical protein
VSGRRKSDQPASSCRTAFAMAISWTATPVRSARVI